MKILGMIGPMQLAIMALVLLLPVIALIDIVRNEFTESNKLIWVLVVVFLPVIGSLLYFMIGSNHKVRK